MSRTRGSVGWLAFYTVFVLAVTVHAPIGLRSVLRRMAAAGAALRATCFSLGLAMLLAWLGMRAVFGVFL